MSISRHVRTFSSALVAAALLAACAAGTAEVGSGGDRSTAGLHVGAGERWVPAADAPTDEVVAASWRLGLAALGTGDGGATVVSPSSLVVALSMLAEGASGDGLATLETALGASGDARRDAVGLLRASLETYDGDASVVQDDELPATPLVHQASQVVVDEGRVLLDGFLDRLVAGYGAGVLVSDLGTSDGIEPLHAWASEHTGGLVERSAIEPDPDLVAVLQDAIALAAAWQVPFEAHGTHDAPFRLPDGTDADVPTMYVLTDLAHVARDGWEAVRLPYTAGDGPGLHTDVVLPPAGTDVRALPSGTLADLVAALDEAPLRSVELSLPRLDLESRLELSRAFDAAGIGHLLDARASGLDQVLEDEVLEVGQAVQQAVLKVEEAGTRAAALTEIGMRVTGMPMSDVQMVVDRPFLLTVADSTTGWPLFLAGVADPR